MAMLEAIEQRASAQGVPVDARIERGRSYRHALARLLEQESFDRVVVPATLGGHGLLRRRPGLAAGQGPGRGPDPPARPRGPPGLSANGNPRRVAPGCRQAHPQRPGGLEHRGAGGGADRGLVGEAVDQAGVAAQGDLDARLPHPQRVGLALVAQRVEAGGGDVGGRQAAEVGAEDRDPRIGEVDAGGR